MDRTYLMVDDYLPSVLNRWYFKCVHSVCLGGIFARAFVWLRFCSNDLVQLIPLPTSVQTRSIVLHKQHSVWNETQFLIANPVCPFNGVNHLLNVLIFIWKTI